MFSPALLRTYGPTLCGAMCTSGVAPRWVIQASGAEARVLSSGRVFWGARDLCEWSIARRSSTAGGATLAIPPWFLILLSLILLTFAVLPLYIFVPFDVSHNYITAGLYDTLQGVCRRRERRRRPLRRGRAYILLVVLPFADPHYS